jgi:hypothetical protein
MPEQTHALLGDEKICRENTSWRVRTNQQFLSRNQIDCVAAIEAP